MQVTEAQAKYARQIVKNGERVSLRRGRMDDPTSVTAKDLRARIVGYQAVSTAQGVEQGDRMVILLAQDLVAAGFPGAPSLDDTIIRANGTALRVHAVDDASISVDGVTVAYKLHGKGL